MEFNTAIIEAIDGSTLNRGLDGAAWLATDGNVPIVMEAGGAVDIALFDYEGDSTYEIHVLFHSRGRAAIDAAKEALRRMFDDYGAELIYAMVPEIRPDVKMLARWAGMKFVGRRDTGEGPCLLFVLSKEMREDIEQ